MTALEARPHGAVSADGPDRLPALIAGWLIAAARSQHTRDAYQADLRMFLGFLAHHGIDPLEAGKTHVDAWHRMMAETPTPKTGRPPAPATLARRVSSVASFYAYLLDEDVVQAVPVRKSSRPKAPTESTTGSLTKAEASSVLARLADAESLRDRVAVSILLLGGLRVSELIGLDVGDVQPAEGYEAVLTVRGKGQKTRTVPMPEVAVEALGEYLDQRARQQALGGVDELDDAAPLIVTAGGGRLTQRGVTRTVQRVCRAAGVPTWRRVSPHWLRHTCATLLLDEGVGIDRVQALLGHADTRTTLRYDRARGAIGRKGAAVDTLAAALARPRGEGS